MIQRALQLVLALFVSAGLSAQKEDAVIIKRIADDIMLNGKAYENLRYLCKEIGARLSGSPQAQKAVEATARMLKDAGADTVYLQPCMVPHWIRGEKETGYIALANGTRRQLNLCSLGNAEGTGAKGISSTVIEVRSLAELAALGAAIVRGKIVFFNFKMNPTYIKTFLAYGESGIARRSGPSEAARLGAIGVMVRSLATNNDDFPHTGLTQYNDSFPKIPAVAISTNDADWLSSALKRRMMLKVYFRTMSKMLPDAPSFNVVGELRGSDLPDKIITVGGHLDSWDLAEGAQDDGAGCVQSIEVLRAFKAGNIRPRHTVRAVMFMNEENGGRGGEKYLELARTKNEQHVFAMESDAGGFTPRGFALDMDDSRIEKIRGWRDLLYEYGVYDLSRGGGGSDIGPLKEIGTPLAGLSPDSQRYFDIHHAGSDVFEIVNKRELHLGAVNMAALIYLVDKYGL